MNPLYEQKLRITQLKLKMKLTWKEVEMWCDILENAYSLRSWNTPFTILPTYSLLKARDRMARLVVNSGKKVNKNSFSFYLTGMECMALAMCYNESMGLMPVSQHPVQLQNALATINTIYQLS